MDSGDRPPPRFAAFWRSRWSVSWRAHTVRRNERKRPRVGSANAIRSALEDVGEEVLGQVLSLLRRVSVVPDVSVDRIPIRLAEARQRLPRLGCVAAGRRGHATPLRRGKPARDITIRLKSWHSLPHREPTCWDSRCTEPT